MYQHIIRIAKERDRVSESVVESVHSPSLVLKMSIQFQYHSNWITSLMNETDPRNGTSIANSTVTNDNNHLAVELANLKSKLRKFRQEL